jgi:hypothetical protein
MFWIQNHSKVNKFSSHPCGFNFMAQCVPPVITPPNQYEHDLNFSATLAYLLFLVLAMETYISVNK